MWPKGLFILHKNWAIVNNSNPVGIFTAGEISDD